jgi:hypothetical protein
LSSKRSVKAMLKRARRKSQPFTTVIAGEELTGTLTAVPYLRWQELVTDNPPRDGNAADAGWGFSVVTFWAAALRAGWTEPAMDDEDWDAFFETAPVGEVNRLGMEVFALTVRPAEVDVPKSSGDSPETDLPSSD